MVRAEKLQKYLSMGRSEEQAAVVFGIPKSAVKQLLSLLDLARPVQQAVQAGKLSPTAAAQLVGLTREEQVKALQEVKEGKATVEETRRVVKKQRGVKDTTRPSRKELKRALMMLDDSDGDRGAFVAGICAALRWAVAGDASKIPPAVQSKVA
jgi:ParB-like chromosome segregation protein Spo0J